MIPWIALGMTYLGQTEKKGKEHNPLIVNMFSRIKLAGIKDDETAWCAAFVGSMLEGAGFESTRSAAALSYAKYGVKCLRDYGAIACLERRNSAGKLIGGHVAFVVGKRADGAIMLLGGNQGDKVSIAPFASGRIVGYRWPTAYPLPKREPLPLFDADGTPLSSNEA